LVLISVYARDQRQTVLIFRSRRLVAICQLLFANCLLSYLTGSTARLAAPVTRIGAPGTRTLFLGGGDRRDVHLLFQAVPFSFSSSFSSSSPFLHARRARCNRGLRTRLGGYTQGAAGAHATRVLEEGSRRSRSSNPMPREQKETHRQKYTQAVWSEATRMRNLEDVSRQHEKAKAAEAAFACPISRAPTGR
jgi:hypothetical protein